MKRVPDFTIQRAGNLAVVMADGKQVSRWMALHRARTLKDDMQASGKVLIRKCMCCPTEFVSTGPYHRMCDKCRSAGASAETVAV